MTQKLVTKKELRSLFGVPYSFAHIARREAAGQFPKRVYGLQSKRSLLGNSQYGE
jgi:hypothetical protein